MITTGSVQKGARSGRQSADGLSIRDHFRRGWLSGGLVNGESYLESLPLVWEAVGGSFDQPVTRMFICQSEAGLAGDVLALSAPLPDDLVIGVDTPVVDRTFNYRLYLR